MKAVTITVSGKVQGVFFRKYTQQQAEELGLNGSVKNLSNGNVYIEVVGAAVNVDQFIEWCRIGSPMSVVTDIEISDLEASKISETGFKIAY